MAKLTERVAIDSADISDDDLIHIVHDAGGTPISYKMTVAQFKTFISAITGSGVDNQIAVYNGTDSIEGDTSLTWDGNTITVTGDVSNKAQLKLDSDSTQNALVTLNTNGGSANSLVQFQISDLTKYMIGINGEDSDATNEMLIIANGDSFDDDGVIVMKPNGNVGIGLGNSAEPSANKLEIGASDATNASLKIREQSATPTTPESGQLRNDSGSPMWYDGTQWVDLAGGGGASLGTDTQIPYMNATNDDYDYSASLTYNGETLSIGDAPTYTSGSATSNGLFNLGGNIIKFTQRGLVSGNTNTIGATNYARNFTVSGFDNELDNGDNNSIFGADNIIKDGDYNFNAGFSNNIYGDKNIALGDDHDLGSSGDNATKTVAIGHDVQLNGTNRIVIGNDIQALDSWGHPDESILFGIRSTIASIGMVRDPGAGGGAPTNFVMGGRYAPTTNGAVQSGMGSGVMWFNKGNSSNMAEPTVNIADSFALYTKDRVAGKTGMLVHTEDGTKHLIADRVGINNVAPSASLEVKGEGTTSGTSSLKAVNSTGTNNFEVKDNGVINASNLPTSSAGLSSGDIYNDAGTLKIV